MASEEKEKIEETKINKEETKLRFKRTKKFYNSYKKTFWIIFILFILLFFFLGTKIILYVNLMLGNDIILTLSTEKQEFLLKNDEMKNITFLVKVKTNPFCKATCISEFEDLSKNMTIKKEEFTLSAQKPLILQYEINADLKGNGQKLYSETLKCKSIETAICRTLGDYTSRNILITLNHELNDNEKILKQTINNTIIELKNDIEYSFEISNVINKTFENNTFELTEIGYIIQKNIQLEKKLFLQNQKLLNLKNMWENEDYLALDKESRSFQSIIEIKSSLIGLYAFTNTTLNERDRLLNNYNLLTNSILTLNKLNLENESSLDYINSNIRKYNLEKNEFETSINLTLKNKSIEKLRKIINDTLTFSEKELNFEIEKRKNEANLTYSILCGLGAECINTSFINNISTLDRSCEEIGKINKFFITINSTINESIILSINDSIKHSVSNLKKQILNNGKENLNLIIENKDLVLYEFIQSPLIECKLKQLNIMLDDNLIYESINMSNITNFNLNFSLEEQTPKCCINNNCVVCCKKESCENQDYPILFVHGHSFNKRLETDYSLDAFNKIQDNLEAKGYINAGAISMYSPENEVQNWEEIPTPLSIKVSYYYDIFKTQEDYVLIQTKSENIDTYALRLNDLINTILQKTGKKKVTIISHSMGGLVTRRYIQIFGSEKIDKFIMIATPNSGVTGAIAQYCTLVGEKQECKDLQAESLFLNKLNRDNATSNIKSYVIYGSGCDTNGKDGDGVVTVDSAKLPYSTNIEIKGNCTTFNTLHTDLLDTDKYPQVYKAIAKIIN